MPSRFDLGMRFICLVIGMAMAFAIIDRNWVALIIAIPAGVYFLTTSDRL